MKPLESVRRAVPFDPSFAETPHFWALRRAWRALGPCGDFPPVGDLTRVFACEPPVRFVVAAPPRRRAAPLDPRALYDARITLEGVVPTRERSWHDFMNALVWGTFPRAKRALHARQHAAIAARIAPGARTLPPARTRELDALALLDEGGVVLIDGEATIFGHAIYESLALGVAPAVVAAIVVDPSGAAGSGAERIAYADAALEAVLTDRARLTTPAELKRVDLTSTSPGAWATDGPSDESFRPMAS